MPRTEEETNIIMNNNWNRMSEITKKTHRTELLNLEMQFRTGVQNKMANRPSKEEEEKVLDSILDFNEKVKKSGVKSKWLK
jgi:hypothetical protein